MKILLGVCVLFFIAAVQAQQKNEEGKDKRAIFLTSIGQTVVRPAVLTSVVRPVIQTVVNPVMTTHHLAHTGVLTRVFKRSAEKDESKDKRDLFLAPIRQTIVRPALVNRVVQPVIQNVVQPVITQKTFQTVVNPVVTTQHLGQTLTRVFKRSADTEESKDKRSLFLAPIAQTVVRPAVLTSVVRPVIQTFVNPVMTTHHLAHTGVLTRVFKRSAEKDESKDKRDLFLAPIRQTIVRPALVNRVVQPVIQDVVQPVITQKTFQTVVNPVVMQHHVGQTFTMLKRETA